MSAQRNNSSKAFSDILAAALSHVKRFCLQYDRVQSAIA